MLVAITTTVVLGPQLFPATQHAEPPLEVALAVGSADLAVVPEPVPRSSTSPDATVVLAPVVVTTTTEPPGPPPTVAPRTSSITEADVVPTTTTTAPRVASTTTTSAPAARKATAATSTSSTTTSTTSVPTPTTAPPVAQSDGVQFGDVSWYDLEGARPGICAHRYLDRGTSVTITNLATGASITCIVGDRGPYSGDGKILDLFKDDFARLAPLEEGVVAARLDW